MQQDSDAAPSVRNIHAHASIILDFRKAYVGPNKAGKHLDNLIQHAGPR